MGARYLQIDVNALKALQRKLAPCYQRLDRLSYDGWVDSITQTSFLPSLSFPLHPPIHWSHLHHAALGKEPTSWIAICLSTIYLPQPLLKHSAIRAFRGHEKYWSISALKEQHHLNSDGLHLQDPTSYLHPLCLYFLECSESESIKLQEDINKLNGRANYDKMDFSLGKFKNLHFRPKMVLSKSCPERRRYQCTLTIRTAGTSAEYQRPVEIWTISTGLDYLHNPKIDHTWRTLLESAGTAVLEIWMAYADEWLI